MRHTLKAIPFEPVTFFQGGAGDPPTYHEDESASWLSPFGWKLNGEWTGYPIEETFVAPPAPLDDVTITVTAYADLEGILKYATVLLNDTEIATEVFKDDGNSCAVLSTAEIVIPAATWITLVGGGNATIEVALSDYCNAFCSPPAEEYAKGKIGISYIYIAAPGPEIAPGPAFHRWRSVTQYYNGVGELVWLYATLVWDPILKQHRWRVQSTPMELQFYGGAGHGPKVATARRRGNVSSEIRVPRFYRPRLLKVVGIGECSET